MPLTTASRLARTALALAAAAACGSAAAQGMTLALTPTTAPIVNAVTQGVASSLYVDVTNTSATTLSEIYFTTPFPANGGAGPTGWALQGIQPNGGGSFIGFQISTCGQGGLATGQKGTFRIDMTPGGTIPSDRTTDRLSAAVFSNPCGANPWGTASVTFPRKTLSITGAASPTAGAAPLSETVTFTVTNHSSGNQSGIALTGLTVTPAAGAPSCSPGTLSINSGVTKTFTCSISMNPASATSYTVAAGAGNGSATAAGVTVGPILVGPATAAFAFDNLAARPGDVVRATLTVTNQTGSAIAVTPPTYAQLTLTSTLTPVSGAANPAGVSGLASGQSASFVYALTVSGPTGATYSATGTASTSAGSAPPATTPAGTISAWQVSWAPSFLVTIRTAAPYPFTVTVANSAFDPITQVKIVNPNAGWGNLVRSAVTNSGGSTFAYSSGSGTKTLTYTGSMGQGAASTFVFTIASAPNDTQTTSYPFQVVVTNTWAASQTFNFTVVNDVPIPDVASVSVLSNATGQTLYWANTAGAGAGGAHDGVVVLRAAAPTVPSFPVDGVDYAGSTTVAYADDFGSAVTSIVDASPGAYNYRICNHDSALVYSGCKTAFWNNAGWIDSAAAPAGGWTHTVGLPALLRPGLVPGGNVGFAANLPGVQLLAGATGARSLGPKPLGALPAVGTPALPLSNGRQVLFAADNSGTVTAVDLQSGATYWQVTKAGEAFIAGVAGVLRQYAGAAFQARYANDVLFLASSSGNLLALDATTGATLWTAASGNSLRALPLYDYAKNWVYAPTFSGGIVAYDLSSTTPPAAPSAAAGWTNAIPAASYTLGCTFADLSTQMTCVDRSGNIRLLDRSTGAVVATGTFTGTGSPSTAWKVSGGVVVGSAGAVQAFTLSGATFTSRATYSPGLTLSPIEVFESPAPGAIYVGGSDLKIHKLRLDTLAQVGSVTVSSQLAGVLLGPPVYDVNLNLLVFGASDGRIWAVPAF